MLVMQGRTINNGESTDQCLRTSTSCLTRTAAFPTCYQPRNNSVNKLAMCVLIRSIYKCLLTCCLFAFLLFLSSSPQLGISNDNHVVVYETNTKYGMFSSARLWWMFKVRQPVYIVFPTSMPCAVYAFM